jgi:hypothetical protein
MGQARRAQGHAAEAQAPLTAALAVAERTGLPAPAWEAAAALAALGDETGGGDEAPEHPVRARAIVEELAASLPDAGSGEGLRAALGAAVAH